MPYRAEDPWDDEEEEDQEWDDDDDDLSTITCPYCRAEIYEEAEQCPECGEYISSEDRAARYQWQPRWIVLTAALLLLIAALGLLANW